MSGEHGSEVTNVPMPFFSFLALTWVICVISDRIAFKQAPEKRN